MSDKEDDDKSKLDNNKSPFSLRRAKKLLVLSEYLSKQESRNTSVKVSRILKKAEHQRTEDEKRILSENQDIAKRIHKNKEKRQLTEQRVQEIEDSEEDLQKKCEELAKAIQKSKRTVIYTGAGISTAASIPDYRGPQGVWTLLQKGEQLKPQDLSDAEPTLTHMCITKLQREGHVGHVVSQNCDGLHLRSGLPRKSLSEVHGNMFIEVCYNCKPHREYIRLFDVTESTGVRRHDTGRKCYRCGGSLKDTIVHFGEKGGLKSPYRWKEAGRAANKADLIICLGSSLKILKKYGCLWCMDRVKNQRPDLVIVNLQWTPKDDSSTLKIHGRCDDVLSRVLGILGYTIPKYSRDDDPIYRLAICLNEEEMNTTTKKVLEKPAVLQRLRSARDYRTPTPSEVDSSSSSSSSSSDSQTDETSGEELDVEEIIKDLKVKEQTRKISKPLTTEESYQSKSERICLEALQAMQSKQANKQTADATKTDKVNSISRGSETISPNKTASVKSVTSVNPPTAVNLACTITGLQNRLAHQQQQYSQQQQQHQQQQQQQNVNHLLHLQHHLPDAVSQVTRNHPQHQYIPCDPLAGSPFDPGPTHQQKLLHLQMLQMELETLKQKQIHLKQKDPPGHQQINLLSGTMIPTGLPPLHLSPPAAIHMNTSPSYQALPHQYVSPTHLNTVSHHPQYGTATSPEYKNGFAPVITGRNNMKTENNSSVKLVSLLDQKHLSGQEMKKCSVKQEEISQEVLISQVLMEQSNHEKQLAILRQTFEKEMRALQAYQEGESSRLYQLHLVQQQVMQQGQTSPRKLEENRLLFVQQQQLLVQHQSKRRQDLIQRHQLEYSQLATKLSHVQQESLLSMNSSLLQLSQESANESQGNLSFHNYSSRSQSQLSSSSFIPKTVSLSSQMKSDSCPRTKTGISAKNDAKVRVSKDDTLKSSTELKVDVASVKKCEENNVGADNSKGHSPRMLLSPGKTDFSIEAIMHHASTSSDPSVPAKIPGFSDLVDKLTRCESCRFLNDYGIAKQRCSKCNDLKMRHSVPCSQMLASSENPKTTFQKVPNLNTHHSVSSPVLHPSVTSESSSKMAHEQDYLTTVKSSVKDNNGGCSSLTSGQVIRSKATGSVSDKGCYNETVVSTSVMHVKESGTGDNHELSPVIPYASGESRKDRKSMQKDPPVISFSKSGVLQQAKQETKEKVKDCLPDDCKATGSSTTLKPVDEETVVGCRPHRSHSQSEIYDKQGQGTPLDKEETRLARSMSTDEVPKLADRTGGKGDNSSPVKQEEATKIGKKRKPSTPVSVPGWFGKGLNLKKRKRY